MVSPSNKKHRQSEPFLRLQSKTKNQASKKSFADDTSQASMKYYERSQRKKKRGTLNQNSSMGQSDSQSQTFSTSYDKTTESNVNTDKRTTYGGDSMNMDQKRYNMLL